MSLPLLWLLLWQLASAPDPAVADQLARLEGHRVTVSPDGRGFTIESVAGEGPPRVGVVERRGEALWLVEDGGAAHRLVGPLAIPRIAGPGYRVWVLGDTDGETLRVHRLGVLIPPER